MERNEAANDGRNKEENDGRNEEPNEPPVRILYRVLVIGNPNRMAETKYTSVWTKYYTARY